MKAKVVFLVTILALGLLFLSACSDKTKDNPTRPVYSDTGLVAKNNFNSFSIFFSTILIFQFFVASQLLETRRSPVSIIPAFQFRSA